MGSLNIRQYFILTAAMPVKRYTDAMMMCMLSRVLTRQSCCALAVALLALPLWAQTIYIWEDENGITHFADRPPESEQEVTIQRAVAEPQDIVSIRKTGPEESPVWLFANRMHGPVTVRVELAEAENVISEPELPTEFVLGPVEERELVTLGAFDERRSWRYRFQTQAVPGRSGAQHQPTEPYRPPFAPGAGFRVGQAFGGEHSHDTPASRHAVDIAMPVGTPVHAARAGVVMDLARYFHAAGQDLERYGPRANFVRILHADGSMAVYAHLDYEGVDVRLGQQVRRGQRIGRSGNTGFSTGPHLHFVVQVNRAMELRSVPFEFADPAGKGVQPAFGLEIAAP